MLKKIAFCILILLVFIGGCTTNLYENNGTVQVTSAPSGAEVHLDNENHGTTLNTMVVPTQLPPPTPTNKTTSANVRVISLDVIPIVAEPGQAVTVNVKVTNAGETIGTNKVALTINGAEEEHEMLQ